MAKVKEIKSEVKWGSSSFSDEAREMFEKLGITTIAAAKRACVASGISPRHPALASYSPETIRNAADFGIDLSSDDWAISEIRARGGETAIVGGWSISVVERDGKPDPLNGVLRLSASGWRQYSRSFGARPAELHYLAGIDDNGPWAVRIAAGQGLSAIIPKAARDAEAKGRRVIRQGDAFFVECAPRYADEGSINNITFDPETRTYSHHPANGLAHRPVHVPFSHRIYFGEGRHMGRQGNYLASGD